MSLKDTIIDVLGEKPVIGLATTSAGTVMPFIEALTSIAQAIGAVCGAVIGVMTVYSLHRKYKTNKNERKNP